MRSITVTQVVDLLGGERSDEAGDGPFFGSSAELLVALRVPGHVAGATTAPAASSSSRSGLAVTCGGLPRECRKIHSGGIDLLQSSFKFVDLLGDLTVDDRRDAGELGRVDRRAQ